MTASPFQPASEKVWIGSIDEGGESGNKDGSLSVEAQYNPGTLEVKQSVPWKKPDAASQGTGANAAPKADKNYMVMEFTGAEGREISLELLFDDFEKKDGVGIVKKIERLETLARVRKPGSNADPDRRPHHCVVVWANVLPRFQCVITALSTKYTMFLSDGTPVRATVTITLKEALRVDRKKA